MAEKPAVERRPAIDYAIKGERLQGLATIYVVVTVLIGLTVVAALLLNPMGWAFLFVALLLLFNSTLGAYVVWTLTKRSAEHADYLAILGAGKDDE